MKSFSVKKAKNRIIQDIHKSKFYQDLKVDEEGRIIVETELFLHSDFSIWDAPEEDDDGKEIVEETLTFDQLSQLAAVEKDLIEEHNPETIQA